MMGMPRVLLIGHGCREAALAVSIAAHGKLFSVARFSNPLIADLSEDIRIVDSYLPEHVLEYATSIDPEFVMVGPEEPIAAGIGDVLTSSGLWVCAPSRLASRLEWDKVYMREFLSVHCPDLNIPHVVARTSSAIRDFFQRPLWPVVVKPNGLSGGKGVRVEGVQLATAAEAEAFAEECLANTGEPVLLERRTDGIEYTLHCVTDGTRTSFYRATYDYSYRFPGDKGGHTGGMGSYCSSSQNLPFMTMGEYDAACDALRRVLAGLKDEGVSYTGILQGQFFFTEIGLKVCEFACRFGDPEAMNLLDTSALSWVEIMELIRSEGLRDDFLPSFSVLPRVVTRSILALVKSSPSIVNCSQSRAFGLSQALARWMARLTGPVAGERARSLPRPRASRVRAVQ